jgi:Amt family ammonium transporter
MTPGSISAGDTAWVLVASALVLLMVPALALFYAGLVRQGGIVLTSRPTAQADAA